MLKKVLKILTFIAVIAVLGVLFLGRNGLLNLYRIDKENQSLSQSIDSAQQLLEAKYLKIYLLQNDSFYMESTARTLYGMSKPNEQIYIFVDSVNNPKP
ncbi:MAG: septum formation initiator family protein [Fibrobacter sp.]|nr:septum formation initiator family protein [Fibrobacter sp.]